MGSARVQYELERTLPSLQLASAHGLFSRDVELRSITQRRRHFENALVRRHALIGDFLQYIAFEEELERLRVLRVTRLKDVNEIPRQDMIKMQKESISHIVSIFERGVRRLKFHIELWKYYITWARSKKMRVVVSRVSARALALFPNQVELWLLVANHEFNDNQSASTARALLQRGLRLNSISHRASLRVQAEERPKKKARRAERTEEGEPSKPLQIVPGGEEEDDRATLKVPENEQRLVRIWIEYIRMELAFLERLRRRRIVLGISDEAQQPAPEEEGQTEDNDVSIDSVPINNDGDAVPPSLKSIKEGEAAQEAPISQSLLSGAIPMSALRSAISLQSSTSLPPRTHFAFLLAFASLVRTFPFYSDTQDIRSALLASIRQALRDRFPNDPCAMLAFGAAPLLDFTHRSALASLSELEAGEELEDGKLLKAASALDLETSASVVGGIFVDTESIARSLREEEEEAAGGVALSYLAKIVMDSLILLKESVQLAKYMREVIEALRKQTFEVSQPTGLHFALQLRIIRHFAEFVEVKQLGESLKQYLSGCAKRVISDAKKLHCDGIDVEREEWRGKVLSLLESKDEDAATAKLMRLEGRLLEACERYGGDGYLLLLYAKVIVQLSDSDILNRSDMLKRWNRLQKHQSGEQSADIWAVWADWVECSEDKRWKVAELQTSLSKTIKAPSTHELLLQRYLATSDSLEELLSRLSYVEKKAYPRASLWRWAIDRIAAGQWMLSEEEKQACQSRVYTTLLRSGGADVEDHCSNLRFLMLDADEPVKGLGAFQSSMALFRHDTSRKTTLEREWDDIRARLREREKDEEDDGEVGEGSGVGGESDADDDEE